MNNEQKLLTDIQKLDSRIERLLQRKRRIAGQKKRGDRKIESRKKFIVGTLILEKAAREPKVADWLKVRLDTFLKSDRDRALFNLPVVGQPAAAAASASTSAAQNSTPPPASQGAV